MSLYSILIMLQLYSYTQLYSLYFILESKLTLFNIVVDKVVYATANDTVQHIIKQSLHKPLLQHSVCKTDDTSVSRVTSWRLKLDRKPATVDIYKRYNPSTDISMDWLHGGPSVCLVISRPRLAAQLLLSLRCPGDSATSA